MLSTHTRSSRVGTLASDPTPTKYLKSPRPFLYMSVPCSSVHALANHAVIADADAQHIGDLRAPAIPHPVVDLSGVKHHFAHVGVETENAIGNAQRIHRVA